MDNSNSDDQRNKAARRLPRPSTRHSAVRSRSGLLARHPWLTFLLPFIVYMVVGRFEPAAAEAADTCCPTARSRPAVNQNWFGLEYQHYPIVYTVKIALTIAAMLFVLPGYRQFPFRISLLAIVVGVVGVVLWIWHLPLATRTQAPRAARPGKIPRPRRAPGVQPARSNWPPRPPGPTRFSPSASSASRSSCRSSKSSSSAAS